MAALSYEDAKSYLNIVDDKDQVEIEATIAAAVAVVENMIGPLEPVPVTSSITTSTGSAVLPRFPVASLTSVTASGVTVDLTGITVDDAGVITGLPTGTSLVTYAVGRDPIPADIAQAVKEMLRHLWATQRGPSRRPGSAESSISNTLPGAAYSLPIRVTQLLAPHHVPRVA